MVRISRSLRWRASGSPLFGEKPHKPDDPLDVTANPEHGRPLTLNLEEGVCQVE
jgi:hypothetical protein